ncbi:asparagine synthetase B [Sphingorhabdus lutea]|uniref:asparagine synthase (glutamine-hydrolyzing) n=1 Tax=Sphingorhabdus lutea TaxID=1913578 RepID=A0A1L3JEV5_9SPHN|nr:XrtA/PEP-CTERM system amidotransferase [Sphingorhabdus lutea]APG63650.1 asparagine synthetase B [Sphingorhabdus lutea]
MCAITGIFHLQTAKPVDPSRVRRMADSMIHRGPDGSGIWTAPGIGLGHRRLSIIDVEGSPQPMVAHDEKWAICFNGEIYNYQEIRAELIKLGHVFTTSGDTEVILHAWRQWGTDCLSKLNGMFAFAIYDAAQNQMHLVRDRFGVKPLYYAEISDGSVIFGSELKALLAHPALRRKLDHHAVDSYMAFGYVPDHQCILQGVQKLPAGHFLTLSCGQPMPSPQKWWDIDFSNREKGSAAELGEELYRLMKQGVASRMVADVPIGAFLSGGVDSSAVVAMMASLTNRPVTSCSIGFDEKSLDESNYADIIAKRFATDHHRQIVDSNQYDLIDILADHFDEPFADASALPTYQVSALAVKSVKVALSGDGADEALAGYRRQVFFHHEEKVRSILPQNFRSNIFGPLAKYYPKADWAPRFLRAKSSFAGLAISGEEAYTNAVGVTGYDARHLLYSAQMSATLSGYRAETFMHDLMVNAPAQSGLDRAQYADLKMWMPGDILTKVDRMSMAVSLEAREPLLDHRIVEFAARLPENMRVRGKEGKWLMKNVMRRDLPEDILYRPKMGFVTPISQWFKGPLADEARALCHSKIFADFNLFDSAQISKMVEQHISGMVDHGRTIWQLVMLEKSLVRLFG